MFSTIINTQDTTKENITSDFIFGLKAKEIMSETDNQDKDTSTNEADKPHLLGEAGAGQRKLLGQDGAGQRKLDLVDDEAEKEQQNLGVRWSWTKEATWSGWSGTTEVTWSRWSGTNEKLNLDEDEAEKKE